MDKNLYIMLYFLIERTVCTEYNNNKNYNIYFSSLLKKKLYLLLIVLCNKYLSHQRRGYFPIKLY